MATKTKTPVTKSSLSGENLLPGDLTIKQLKDYYDMANQEYAPIFKRMKLLDGADRSELWTTISAKFPKYQVLPETNHVNKIKEALLASIYTVGKYAEVLPKSATQVELCNIINRILEEIWETAEVSRYERKAGERAALFNYGVTQVGWDTQLVGGTTGSLYKGDIKLKNIDPMKFMKDPYADSIDNASFLVTWEDYHITTLANEPIYKERLAALKGELGDVATEGGSTIEASNSRATSGKENKKYKRVQFYYVKYVDDKGNVQICEAHLLENKYVLYVKEVIAPAMFPFAELYCNEPGSDIIGVSEPAKIFKNYLTYNMVQSIIATHAYKAQRPPRFVNMQSGINIRQFAKYGSDADKTFPVNGDASMAVHYGRFPDLPPIVDALVSRLEFDISDKSGITDQYLGTSTNSVQTTGGMDSLVDRATGRDEVKVLLYEEYTKRLTSIILSFYIKYGGTRTFAVKDKMSNQYQDVEVNFKDISDKVGFDYSLDIHSALPRTKMRLAQAANILLEKQMQYKPNPAVITNEEWLMMQDIPFKSLILDRINIERNNNMTEQVTQILFEFAGLIEQGVDAEQALAMVTDSMQAANMPTDELGAMEQEQPAMGNQADAGSFQQMQAAPTEEF